MTTRNFGYTLGRTEEGDKRDYAELEKRLAEQGKSPAPANPPTPIQIHQPVSAPNQDGFIYVPSTGLYVAKDRSLQENDWDNAHKLLQAKNQKMLTIPEFWEFVNYLKKSYQDKNEANRILDDIFKVGDWRAEWLDAHFEKKEEVFYVNSSHEVKGGVLIPKHSDKLETCIMNLDCYADLSSVNQQGLLATKSSNKKYVQGTNVFFWYPIDTAVAGFYADSAGVGLSCNGIRSGSGAGLGVRAAQQR